MRITGCNSTTSCLQAMTVRSTHNSVFHLLKAFGLRPQQESKLINMMLDQESKLIIMLDQDMGWGLKHS
jgi:hypothetical protein